jgi:hypothetical protein
MKVPKLAFLLFILLGTLILSIFLGVNCKKEGLTYGKTMTLSDIVFNTNEQNAGEAMDTICKMELDDQDFTNIIKSVSYMLPR